MIKKDIAQYEENDSQLAKQTILDLQEKISRATEYLYKCKKKENKLNLIVRDYDELLNILKGDSND